LKTEDGQSDSWDYPAHGLSVIHCPEMQRAPLVHGHQEKGQTASHTSTPKNQALLKGYKFEEAIQPGIRGQKPFADAKGLGKDGEKDKLVTQEK